MKIVQIYSLRYDMKYDENFEKIENALLEKISESESQLFYRNLSQSVLSIDFYSQKSENIHEI
jgi:hypothetical protein